MRLPAMRVANRALSTLPRRIDPHAVLSIVACDFVANAAGLDGDTGEQLGAAIIWSMHQNANCANGTSACWGNDLGVTL